MTPTLAKKQNLHNLGLNAAQRKNSGNRRAKAFFKLAIWASRDVRLASQPAPRNWRVFCSHQMMGAGCPAMNGQSVVAYGRAFILLPLLLCLCFRELGRDTCQSLQKKC